MNGRPLIVHVLYRLDTGGMERVLVSVVRATAQRYRHAVVCLAGFGPLRAQIEDCTVACLSIDKRPGKDWRAMLRLWRALRMLRPDLVHTYNLGALDVAVLARLAGTPRVVHAEHGRDAADPDGRHRKYRWLRRAVQPFVNRFVAVSEDLASWLQCVVGIASSNVVLIRNGVDLAAYAPRATTPAGGCSVWPAWFAGPDDLVIVNVARLDAVKDQVCLIRAFDSLCECHPGQARQWRLAIIGEGPERATLENEVARRQLTGRVWLPGNRTDVPALLAGADVFALSSRAEGIPLTVLEAMAADLPVVATDVGGVGEAVVRGETGMLAPPGDPDALAALLGRYMVSADLRQRHGAAGASRARQHFSAAAMVAAYAALYDRLLAARMRTRQPEMKYPVQGGGS